jgi:hypothetical protein
MYATEDAAKVYAKLFPACLDKVIGDCVKAFNVTSVYQTLHRRLEGIVPYL